VIDAILAIRSHSIDQPDLIAWKEKFMGISSLHVSITSEQFDK